MHGLEANPTLSGQLLVENSLSCAEYAISA
jgi:hypothetical protein